MWDMIVSVPDHCLSFYFSSCGQWWLGSDWVNAQAYLSIHWVNRSFCWICHAAAHSAIFPWGIHIWIFKILACTVLAERTDNPKPICTLNFFEVGGIMTEINMHRLINFIFLQLNMMWHKSSLQFSGVKWVLCSILLAILSCKMAFDICTYTHLGLVCLVKQLLTYVHMLILDWCVL